MKNLFGNRTWAQYSIKTLLAKLYWNKAMFKQLWFLRDQETAVQKSDSSERLSILYMLPWEQVIHIWEWLNLLWNQEVTFSGNERTMQSAISHYLNSHPSGRIWFLFLLWPPPLSPVRQRIIIQRPHPLAVLFGCPAFNLSSPFLAGKSLALFGCSYSMYVCRVPGDECSLA